MQEIDEAVAGQTVPSEFVKTVEEHGDLVALRWLDGEEWKEWTFTEYAGLVARAATGLQALGVQPGDHVVLMMRNRPEFHVVDMAALFVGATPVSIYNSSSSEQVQYLASHCDAKVAVVEDPVYLRRFLDVRDELPLLEHLVIIDDHDGVAGDSVMHWSTLLSHAPLGLAEAAASISPDRIATVIYTSGTTGPPKGVLLSHYNITFTAESLKRTIELDSYAGKKVVSYLPMAHIAERMTSHYMQALLGYTVTTCPEPGAVATFAREVRPNIMFGVPRVWEKVYAGVNAALAGDHERKKQFDEAVAAAKPIVQARAWDRASAEDLATYEFLDQVAFSQVRELIGLNELDIAITGAAPMTQEILEWFRAIGVPLSEIYGMSESSGPMTFVPFKVKPGTVGPAIHGCEVALADDGEIVCRGGNVFLGYIHDPEKTAEALDADGWLHSGDIGTVDEDGYYRIVDRKKELIITAGGKNISPANLEAALKAIPLIGQACAIGDNRPFISALLALDPEVAPAWARANDIDFDDLEDLARNPVVHDEVQLGVDEINKQFSRVEQIKKWVLLGEEWLADSDVLTPTSKLKRRGISAKYADVIEAMYA
ncbi:MAG: AMP-binding protein [Acidimicrobiales bacterium]|nr:AMP-binding protein [Acidimicrobiales bacterium]